MRQSVRVAAWIGVATVIVALGLLSGCGGSGDIEQPVEPVAPADTAAPDAAALDLLSLADIPPPEEFNRIIADVNGTQITFRRVYQVAEMNKLRLETEEGITFSEEGEQLLQRQALDLIIDAELMIHAATADGMTIDSELVEQQFQEVRGQFGSDQDFQEYLDKAELTEQEIREEAERRLLALLYRSRVAEGVTVDEAEMRRFYEEKPELFQEGGEVHAAYILIKSAPDDPAPRREEARKRTEEAYQRILNGEDFAQIAMEYSQAPNAAKGGDVGFFPRGVMVPQFEDVAFKTPVGEVTEIFETVYGYNVLKVLDRKEPVTMPFEEVKPALTAQFTQRNQDRALRERLDELRETATVNILDEAFIPRPQGQEPEGGEQG